MKNSFKLDYVDQNWDGFEGWIIKENEFRIRLDFILEYYISQNVDLTSKIKGKRKNIKFVKEYSLSLFEKFLKLTNEGTEFDYEDYKKWSNMENPEIKKIIEMINK